jgi:tRNA A37 threonylcarbamoyladenosine biosynthesis protein TsaE
MQRYATSHPVWKSLTHIDAYRLTPGDAHTIAWSDIVTDRESLVLVEWPERLGEAFPTSAPILTFDAVSETERVVVYA